MRTYVLHRLDEIGAVVKSELFHCPNLDAALAYARPRLSGYAQVQICDDAECLARIERNQAQTGRRAAVQA
jgi:hypothetical protein